MCNQPAFGWAPVSHDWIKTDTIAAGMGAVGGNENAGNESADLPGDPVEVTNHSGRHKQDGTTCQKMNNVDEKTLSTET